VLVVISREKYDGFFCGHNHVSEEAVSLLYSKAVEGCLAGDVFLLLSDHETK
jgi:hypothetical protein